MATPTRVWHAASGRRESRDRIQGRISDDADCAFDPQVNRRVIERSYAYLVVTGTVPGYAIMIIPERGVDALEERLDPKLAELSFQCEACGPDLELYQRHR